MLDTLLSAPTDGGTLPLIAVPKADCARILDSLEPASWAAWAKAGGFDGRSGAVHALPGTDGALAGALVGLGDGDDPWAFAAAAEALPAADYHLVTDSLPDGWADDVATAWALAAYRFSRYKRAEATPRARLLWPDGADRAAVARLVEATALVRDLVNTPAEDMGPADLADAANALALRHNAQLEVVVGDFLAKAGFPMIHAVGRASTRAPRLIDLIWGDPAAPRLTLVGKGVCFDTGGLDLKPSAGMRLMKKDMGGAAHVLALAGMIMDAALPVRLRVLIPAVDNAVSGGAFRPGDVLQSRKGLTVEVGNTDAEGRLVLADALTEAAAEKPDLLIDCATLTGAARVALGPELPAMFSNDDVLAESLESASLRLRDPIWRMPLWAPYKRMVESKIADLNNAPDGPFAGSITAALFLQAFVEASISWVHLDLFAWQPSPRPGRPEGGAAQALKPLMAVISERFGGK